MALPAVLVDSLLVVKMFQAQTNTPYDRYLNVLKYRCFTAGSGAFDYEPIFNEFDANVITPMRAFMFESMNVVQVRMQVFQLDVAFFEHIVDIPICAKNGDLSDIIIGYVPQIAAVLTRRSYKSGRAAIGRTFFGPLSPQYVENGSLKLDPASAPDLEDLAAAFRAELDGVGSGQWRPCITPLTSTSETLTADADQRVAAWSNQVSTLRSRRLGSV